MAKIKLSVCRGENIAKRNAIDDQRREKQLRLQILADIVSLHLYSLSRD